MTTPLASGAPTPIYIYLDGDGTIYPDLQLYLGLGNAIPELGYFPKWTGEQLNAHFVKIQTEIKAQKRETGETNTGVDVVNGELCMLARDGILEGLSNRVIREVGRRELTLHRGVVDFMRDARELARSESEGLAEVHFVINSSNLREGLLGSELGRLAEGPNPLITEITGQSFRERDGIIAYTQRTFSGESKADVLHGHIADGVVDPHNVLVVADGMTDRMLFRANKAGLNVLVNEVKDPDRFAEFQRWAQQQPNVTGPLPADWRKLRTSDESFGILYLTLMSHLRSVTQDIVRAHKNEFTFDSRARLGTYADPVQSQFRTLLSKLPSSEQRLGQGDVSVLNGPSKLAEDPRVTAAVRAAAMFDANVAIDIRTARQLVDGSLSTKGHALALVIPARGRHDRDIRKMLALLSLTPADEISLPVKGSRGYDTAFGRVAVRRCTPEQSINFKTVSGEVAVGTHTGLLVEDYVVPFWVSNAVLQRALHPETADLGARQDLNGHTGRAPVLSMN